MSGFDKDLDKGDQEEEVVTPDLPFDDDWDWKPGDRDITVRGPGQSVPKARAFTKYDPPGMCCQFVWNCIAAPRRFGLADANAAWARAKSRRTDQNPPAGAPVYWAGGKHGHIAISVGGGVVRSTDWPEKGRVGDVKIATMTSSWGITYRGWSADWAGVPIPGLGSTPAARVKLGRIDDEAIRPGKRNDAVRRFNAALWSSMPADYRAATPEGVEERGVRPLRAGEPGGLLRQVRPAQQEGPEALAATDQAGVAGTSPHPPARRRPGLTPDRPPAGAGSARLHPSAPAAEEADDHDDRHGRRDDGRDALDAQLSVVGVGRRVELEAQALRLSLGDDLGLRAVGELVDRALEAGARGLDVLLETCGVTHAGLSFRGSVATLSGVIPAAAQAAMPRSRRSLATCPVALTL